MEQGPTQKIDGAPIPKWLPFKAGGTPTNNLSSNAEPCQAVPAGSKYCGSAPTFHLILQPMLGVWSAETA